MNEYMEALTAYVKAVMDGEAYVTLLQMYQDLLQLYMLLLEEWNSNV